MQRPAGRLVLAPVHAHAVLWPHKSAVLCRAPQVYELSSMHFLPKDWIMERWEEGFYITAMAGSAGGSSLVVMSKGTPYTQQSYKVRPPAPLGCVFLGCMFLDRENQAAQLCPYAEALITACRQSLRLIRCGAACIAECAPVGDGLSASGLRSSSTAMVTIGAHERPPLVCIWLCTGPSNSTAKLQGIRGHP
jgi:hypothetical protein